MQDTSPCQQAMTEPPAGRRSFLRWLTGILGAVGAAMLGIPVVGYFFGLPKPKESWVDFGPVSGFPLNETRRVIFDNPLSQSWDGMTALTIAYARYEGKSDDGADQFLVVSANCAHLGCPVSWFQQSGLFMCPCHGGVYYANGQRASGPPPRGLYHCDWRVQGGRLEIKAPHYPTLHNPLVPQDQVTA